MGVNHWFFMTRPEPLMHHVDYKEYSSLVLRDIKVRWQIHNYEVKKLGQDIQFIFDYLLDEVYFKVATK